MASSIALNSRSPPPRVSSPPLEEGDITHARGWLTKDESGNSRQDSQTRWKGKGRAVDLEDGEDDDTPDSPPTSAYPPVNDDEAETRRIEENLKRWEIAEKQRRKAVRDSSYKDSPSSPSIMEDVTRRASALWPGKSKRPSGSGLGLGSHRVLQSEEHGDILPLTDIASPTPSPTRSDSDSIHPDGPFADPPEALSPFADSHEISTTAPSIAPSDDSALLSPPPHTTSRRSRQPPPPKPLGLPPPRAPPPPISTPAYPVTPGPDVSRSSKQDDDDVKDTRWWHEWLCGFGEGPDRGGDHQAGRTNPFE